MWRLYFLVLLLITAAVGLLWKIIDLGVLQRNFLLKQGAERSVHIINVPAHRGMITDRNGKPLAVSVPIASVWVDPGSFATTSSKLTRLAKLLNLTPKEISKKIEKKANKRFVYLKRHISPDIAQQVQALNTPGVFLKHEYQRYYPEGETTVNVLGFTDIDDRGQEGLELAYDSWLRGIPGKEQVVEDRLGNIISSLGVIVPSQKGHDLVLSIDKRLQYLAFNALKNTVQKYHAEGGTAVVLAVKTGAVLAMVNLPSCNPNDRANLYPAYYRNRAVLDLFEPGSTIKTFTIANALASGKYKPNTLIDTNPGKIKIGGHIIYDSGHVNYGTLTVTGVLQKSSDIGISKIALSLSSLSLLDTLKNVGFGQAGESGFPGEAAGKLPGLYELGPLTLATLAFGYASSVTALQLAHAYTVIAASGVMRPVTFLKIDKPPIGKRVMDAKIAQQVLTMLESVLNLGGTGTRAQIRDYKIAGKTGTAHIAAPHGGYYKDRYFSVFVGIAPVSDPELVVAVMIKNPRGLYYGGSVAAPTFAKIMAESLRVLNIPPDNL